MEQSSSDRKSVKNISKSYKKLNKSFDRGISKFKSLVFDAIDDFAIEITKKTTNCQLCSQFLVLTARNSCCSICFIEWMNEYNDYDDQIIMCRKCNRPINTVLNSDQLNIFCKLVELDEKRKTSRNGHYGYPVLGNSAMDQLYEDIESNSDSSN